MWIYKFAPPNDDTVSQKQMGKMQLFRFTPLVCNDNIKIE